MYRQRGSFSRAYLKRLLDDLRPRVVGIPLYAEPEAGVVRLCRRIREYSHARHARILLGGLQATAAYHEVLQLCPAEIVVRGDGEPVLSRWLARDWRDPGFLASIPGLSFLVHGRLHHNPDQPWGNPDDYPSPAWDISTPSEPFRLHLITAWGSPHHCAFSAQATMPYQPPRVASVAEALRHICQARQPAWMVVVDDTFTAQPHRAKKLSQVLQEHYGGPWSAEVTAGEICRHPSLVREMAAAGLQRLQLGIESMHDLTLQLWGKKSAQLRLRMPSTSCWQEK